MNQFIVTTPRQSLLLLVLVVGFGAGLVGTIASTQGSIRGADKAVTAAQAGQFRSALRRYTQERPKELQTFLSQHSEQGLRYVSISGIPKPMKAGEPIGATWAAKSGPDQIDKLKGRTRLEFRTPGTRPLCVALEFEPLLIEGLDRDAQLALWLGSATALLAILLAWAYRHSMLERAELERERASERHLASLGEMSAVMAHELRNPLTSLRGHAMLLEETVPEPAQKKVRQILTESTRLERLITDLLDFAREAPLEFSEAHPRQLVQDVLRSQGIEAMVQGDAQEPWVMDAERFRQVVQNIVQNAVQATPEDAPPPEIIVNISKDSLQVVIRDHGPGLPDDIDSLFEPFVTHRTKGTGLGLAVVRRIVQKHSGQVQAHNHPEGGAVFTVTLPRNGDHV